LIVRAEGCIPSVGLRADCQREREVVRPQHVDPFEHGLSDGVPPGVRGLRPQLRQRLQVGARLAAASASILAIVASSRAMSRFFAYRRAARSRSRFIRACASASGPPGIGGSLLGILLVS
jgi:hypothetical protein